MSYGIYFSTGLISNIDYWKPLIMEYIEEADGIRIDCWNDEEQIIYDLKELCTDLDLESNCNMHILKFNISEKVINELVYNAIGHDGNIKWFSFFLTRNNDIILSSSHYGKEFSIEGISKEEIQFIKYFIPKGSSINIY